jgi:hypothetical protein
VRPLSQLGLIRVPANPGQRIHNPVPEKRTVLDAINDRDANGYMHPTKGYRPMSEKRSRIALLTAELKARKTRSPGAPTGKRRQFTEADRLAIQRAEAKRARKMRPK